MRILFSQLRPALVMFLTLSLLTGLVYPFAITGIAQVAFPAQANGSPIKVDGKVEGSELIGQPFSRPEHFWGRPSATTPAYNPASSGASNLGPSSARLKQSVGDLVKQMREAHPAQSGPVPLDLVTGSASGLDPHISPAAAFYQVERVAAARHLPAETVRGLVERHVEGRQWGFLGQPRVNVNRLNLDLDLLK